MKKSPDKFMLFFRFTARNQILLLLCGVFSALLLSACETGQSAQSAKPKVPLANVSSGLPANPNRKKIVAFGDSLTAGFGLTEKESYPYLLQERLQREGFDYEVVNAGVSGDTTVGGIERIDWSLNQPNVAVLILELGANDILRGMSIAQMKTNLSKIIEKAKAKNVKVLLCGMYAPLNFGGERGREINAAFQSLADEHKVEFLPFFLEGVGGISTLNQADGIHPNAEGTRKIVETVHKAVKPLLQK